MCDQCVKCAQPVIGPVISLKCGGSVGTRQVAYRSATCLTPSTTNRRPRWCDHRSKGPRRCRTARIIELAARHS